MSPWLALFLLLGAVGLLGWLYLMLRQRPNGTAAADDEALSAAFRLAATDDALLVASEHGRLLHLNDTAHRWLKIDEGEPNLEYLAALAQPSESFLELFGHEGQASFQIAGRWVQAASHRIPAGSEARTVIVMRPLQNGGEGHDLSRALTIVGAVGATVQAGMSVEQVLQTLLTITAQELPADAGEICLYDADAHTLTPRGWIGATAYVLALAEQGGAYAEGAGITGWIARHRKPILIEDTARPDALRPLLTDQPYRSFIGVPLLIDDTLIGTFELASERAGHFGQADLALLQASAPALAAAVKNAIQYEREAQRMADLTAIPQQALESSRDPVTVYRALNEHIARLMEVDVAGVLLYDAERSALVAQEPFHGLPPHVVRSYYIPLPEGSEARGFYERASVWKSADLADEPLAVEMRLDVIVNAAGVRDILLMPMTIGSRCIGFYQTSNRRAPGGFNLRDEQNLRLLAAQAAVVVEEMRLHEQDLLRESEMMSLQEITAAFGALDREGDVFESANAQVARLMGVEICGVLLYDEERLRLVAQLPIYGLDDEIARHYEIALEPNSVFYHMWQSQDYYYTNNVSTDPLSVGLGLTQFAEMIGVRQTMIAALTAGGRRIGVLQVSKKTDGSDFTDKDARILSIFAAQVAAQIDNMRLYRDAQRRTAQAEAARRVIELSGRVLSAEDSFAPTLAEVAALLESPFAFINVIDVQTGQLVTYPRNIFGEHSIREPLVQDVFSPGYEHSVFMSRRSFVSNDALNDRMVLPTYREIARRAQIERVVLVPLAVGKTSLGELGVANRARPYDENDIRLLESVAPQLAAALERLRLYDATGQNLSRRIRELDAISRVTNELAQTLELDRVAQIICIEAQRVTEASGVTMAILDNNGTPQVLPPRIARRLGDDISGSLAPIEQEAITRGADAVIIADYEEPGDLPLRALPAAARSAAAAAILYEDRVVGVLHLFHDQPRRFDAQSGGFLTTMAAKASLAYGNNLRYLENREHSAHLRRRIEQFNRVFEIGQIFQHDADTATMLEAISFSIQQSVGFDIVLIALRNPETGLLERVAQAGMPLEAFDRSRSLRVDADTLLARLKPEYMISDSYFLPFERVSDWGFEEIAALGILYDGKRTMHPRAKEDWRDGDMLLVPLRGVTGELLGVISLDRPFDGRRPNRSTIEILEIFAHQTTASLENARMFSDRAAYADQQAQLNRVLEEIAGTLDSTEIVLAVARGLRHLLPFERITVALQDSDVGGFQIMHLQAETGDAFSVLRDRRADLARMAMGQAYGMQEDILFASAVANDELYEDVTRWRAEGERVSLVLPLVAGGMSLGALHLGSRSLDPAAVQAQRDILRRIVNLAAVALQNARLFSQAINLRLFNESVVQSIQQGIVVLDKSGLISVINDYMKRHYGWNDRAVRQDLFAYRPALRSVLAEPVRRVIESAQPQELLQQQVIENGQTKVENYYLYPLLAADTVRGAVLLIEDVSERYRLERDLAARAQQLDALTEASTRLAAALDRDSVLGVMFDAMQRVLAYDSMTLWRLDEDTLVIEAWRGTPAPAPHTRLALADDARLQQIVRDKRALAVSRRGDEPLPGDMEGESWLGVPVVQKGTVTGVIALVKREHRSYDTQAEQAALTFANQVAIALENAALFDETALQMDRLSLINRVSMALAQSLDTENILEIALREIALLFGGDKGHAYIFEREFQIARAVVDFPRGEEAPSAILRMSDWPSLHHAYGSPAPLIVHDVAQLPPGHPLSDELNTRGLTAYVLVPLLVGGQTGGMFEVEYSRDLRTVSIDAAKIDLALLIANQASIAVLNANLLEQTMVRTRELETLLEAAQATSFTLDLDEVFQSVVRLTVQALDMDDCLLLLYDNIEERLEVMVDFNRSGERMPLIEVGTSYDLRRYQYKRRAMQDLQVITLRSDETTTDQREQEDMRAHGVVTRIFVPLKARDEGIGLLQVDSSAPHRVFTHRESRMAQALGAQAAIAIENARLSTETANQVAQSLVINDLSRAISSTMDIDVMIRIVRDQVPLLTDSQDVYVALYDPKTEMITFPMAARGGQEYEIAPRRLGADEVSFIIRNRRPLPLGGENPSIDEVRRNLGIVNGEGAAKRYLGVPLIAGDLVVGVLAVRDDHETRPFGLNDQRILTTIGTQLGATIQNAQLFEDINERVNQRTAELQQERDRLDALYRVTSELISTQEDIDAALNRTLMLMADAVDADEGVLLLYDTQLERLYCHTRAYGPSDPAARHKDPLDMIGEWLLRSRQPALIEDLHRVPYWNEKLPGAEAWRSAVGAVIGAPEDKRGVAIFISRKPNQFNDSHLRIVSAAAFQIGAALKDAELVRVIRDQNLQLNNLLRSEREERGKSAAILQSIDDGVVVVDAANRVVLMNAAAERILGTQRAHVETRLLAHIAAQDNGGSLNWASVLMQWVMEAGLRGGKLEVERFSFGDRVINVGMAPVMIGESLGTVAVFRDITRDVEVERMKSEFVANVSHELRTPLTSIKGYADLMAMGVGGPMNEQQSRFVKTIRENTERMAGLVSDLLLISNIDSGKDTLVAEPFSLAEAIESVVGSLSSIPEHAAKQIIITQQVAADLPPLEADRIKIMQAVANVVDNAYNYTPAGGRIEIAAALRDAQHVRITIKDSGIGIPQEFQERVWKRFERNDQTALVMAVAGTGLGLPIARQYVEMHGGRIWFESVPNEGTTFYIDLPLRPEQPRPQESEAKVHTTES